MDVNELVPKNNQRINLPQIYDEETRDNIIYSIREEILEKAMLEIDAVITNQRVDELVVDVALEALSRMISFEFYHHNAPPNPLSEAWSCDKTIPPSPPDILAVGRVPLNSKQKIQNVEVEEEEIESESTTLTCECDIGVKCDCLLSPEEQIEEHMRIFDTSFEDDESERESSVSSSEVPSEIGATSDQGLTEAAQTASVSSDQSGGNGEELLFVMKDGRSKIGFGPQRVHLPKIDVSQRPRKVPISKMEELPPIRIEALFSSKAKEAALQKKKKKRK